MNEKLDNAIFNLRAAVLMRRVNLHGHRLLLDNAQRLVRLHNDKEAYRIGVHEAQKKVEFWSRFWWNR